MRKYNPKVKICCILSKKEADIAIKAGASALGLVSEMPSGPGIISEEEIKDIAEYVPAHIDTFLLTSLRDAEAIIRQHKYCNTTTIQFVDSIKPNIYQFLRKKLPQIKFVQVIHVMNQNSIKEALEITSYVDALLLDSGNPNLKTKKLGGTGRVHNWELSRQICELVSLPVYLAGGLNPNNVREAINFVKPYGLDICSGLRTNGKLDPVKIVTFFSNIN
ncbi:MAG: phosphoribosylanthranilate isomerase [Calditrichaceae bacterium]|jgi:phosphoribosylanthranilate isomerase